jgi:hypothetical protein
MYASKRFLKIITVAVSVGESSAVPGTFGERL